MNETTWPPPHQLRWRKKGRTWAKTALYRIAELTQRPERLVNTDHLLILNLHQITPRPLRQRPDYP